MRVFHSVAEPLPISCAVVTVGSYDGLHYGHRALLEEVKSRAAEEDAQSVVVTFWPHPRQVLTGGGDIRLLNTLKEKLYLLEEVGIGNVVVIPFTPEFAAVDSLSFVRDTLVGKIGMKRFVVGYNHRFGSDGGGFERLLGMQQQFGFTAERIGRLDIHEEKVSSTVIRGLIADGNMKKAAEFLTRGYIIIADIIAGRLIIDDEAKLFPTTGRYEVEVSMCGKTDRAVLYVLPGSVALLEGWSGGDGKDAVITFL